MRFSVRRVFAACLVALLFLFTAACSNALTPDLMPHLVEAGDEAPVRSIDEREPVYMSAADGDKEYGERVEELFATVVYDGLRPVFDEGDPVAEIYNCARDILNRYVLNAWRGTAEGEYNTVHALHDYLACNVSYDFALYDRYRGGETDLADDPAFHIDGALVQKKAVCDGISRAFEFLCAIEGIECVRVTGSLASVPHAWNKVKIGGAWYNVDVTADAVHYTVGGGKYAKQLSHGYFLLSDKTYAEFKAQPHVFAESPFVADNDYDYYAGEAIEICGETYALDITSRDELFALFEAVRGAGKTVGKLEVRLNYGGRVQVNSADMYRDDLAAAYKALGNVDFGFSDSVVPYFRYPNGVYLLLIRN